MTVGQLGRVTGSWGAEGGAWSVLVHGGAGQVADELVPRHVRGCRLAAEAAAEVLRDGGAAIDAVVRAVLILEDDPCFNAGTGACLNADGLIELDAALMEGTQLRVGGVCALPPFAHPISIARAVLEDGRHVLYAGQGAARFAVENGFTPSTAEAMTTPGARDRLALARSTASQDGGAGGTVGAVARDARGAVASATSTGGRVNKRAGRVGDSPVPGAGSYADDDGGACSMTGDGEAVLRLCLGKTAVDQLRGRTHPEDVARSVIGLLGSRLVAAGGVILVDRFGRLGLARNTPTMPWAAAGEQLPEPLAGS